MTEQQWPALNALNAALVPGENPEKAGAIEWVKSNLKEVERVFTCMSVPPEQAQQLQFTPAQKEACFALEEKFHSDDGVTLLVQGFPHFANSVSRAFACRIFARRIRDYFTVMPPDMGKELMQILFEKITPDNVDHLFGPEYGLCAEAQAALACYVYPETIPDLWDRMFRYSPPRIVLFLGKYFDALADFEPAQVQNFTFTRKAMRFEEVASRLEGLWNDQTLSAGDRANLISAIAGFIKIAPEVALGFTVREGFLGPLREFPHPAVVLSTYEAVLWRVNPQVFQYMVGEFHLDQIIGGYAGQSQESRVWLPAAKLTATAGMLLAGIPVLEQYLKGFFDLATTFISDCPKDGMCEAIVSTLNPFVSYVLSHFAQEEIFNAVCQAVYKRLQDIWTRGLIKPGGSDLIMANLASIMKSVFAANPDYGKNVLGSWMQQMGDVLQALPLATALLGLLYHLLDQKAMMDREFCQRCYQAFGVLMTTNYYTPDRHWLYHYLLSAGWKVMVKSTEGVQRPDPDTMQMVDAVFRTCFSLSVGKERGPAVCYSFSRLLDSMTEDLQKLIQPRPEHLDEMLGMPILELFIVGGRLLNSIPEQDRNSAIDSYVRRLFECIPTMQAKVDGCLNLLHFIRQVRITDPALAEQVWTYANQIKELGVEFGDFQEIEVYIRLTALAMGPFAIKYLPDFIKRNWDAKSVGATMNIVHALFLSQKEPLTGEIKKEVESREWKLLVAQSMFGPIRDSVLTLKYSNRNSRTFKLWVLPVMEGWCDIISTFFKDEKKEIIPPIMEKMGDIANLSITFLQHFHSQPELLIYALEIYRLIALRFPQQLLDPVNYLATYSCIFSPDFSTASDDTKLIVDKLVEVNTDISKKAPDIWHASVQAVLGMFEMPSLVEQYGAWEREMATKKVPMFMDILSQLRTAKKRNQITLPDRQ